MKTIPASIVAWFVAVAVAYVTNKIWVFESRSWSGWEVIREVFSFVVCRILTGVLDLAVMYVTVDVLGLHDVMMKIISNVLVIVLNFVFSKLVIFKKK